MGGVESTSNEGKNTPIPSPRRNKSDDDLEDTNDGTLAVSISVYQLNLIGAGSINTITTFLAGVYHSAVVVGEDEWAFGGHSEEIVSGVYRVAPERDPQHNFYLRLYIGRVHASIDEIRGIITDFALQPCWRGTAYDLLERNCNHFSSDLCWLLLRRRPPAWINGTADDLSRKVRRHRVEQVALEGAVHEFITEHLQQPEDELDISGDEDESHRRVPGMTIFVDEFVKVFDIVWQDRWDSGQNTLLLSAIDSDPEKLRSDLESGSLASAAAVAGLSATVVATAARLGSRSRAAQPLDAHIIWDDVWTELYDGLCKEWRAQALKGQLDVEGGASGRLDQIHAAIEAAELHCRIYLVDRSCSTACGGARQCC